MAADILITGATGGIGRCLFDHIRNRHEGRIVALGQSQDKLKRLGEDFVTRVVDLSHPAEIASLSEFFKEFDIGYFFQLHGSGNPGDTVFSFSEEPASRLLEVNLFSTIRILEMLLPGMIRRRFGRIVLTSTASAIHGGGKDSFSYGLSKAGVEYLVRHVAKHYAADGVLANAVAPGFISTGFHEKRMNKSAGDVEKRGKSVRVGHPGSPEDVASLMMSLAWDNNFVTGQVVTVDGGDFL
jgi:NAD(P)-dependent dehydrogenase (short-subunit alcohol dehydrogenase family)